MLETVFTKCKPLLRRNAVVYVRTDSRPLTLNITREVLTAVFPSKKSRRMNRPLIGSSQTALFGDKATANGEVDLVLK